MRYIWLGFHIVMLLLFIAAVSGGLSPKTGITMQDANSTVMPTIGVIFLWIIGAIILRFIRRFVRY